RQILDKPHHDRSPLFLLSCSDIIWRYRAYGGDSPRLFAIWYNRKSYNKGYRNLRYIWLTVSNRPASVVVLCTTVNSKVFLIWRTVTQASKIALLFGLIYLVSGRVINSSFQPLGKPRTTSRSNELIDQQNSRTSDQGANRKERLSLAEFSTYSLKEPNGPGTYAFGYDNVFDAFGNQQFRSEEKLQNGTVIGEYGYTDYKSMKIVRVTYTADTKGYRAKTQVLPLETPQMP
ncbi:uncharacterized protein LOC112694964, partial [Athalia rosae]|uniref:uncharacterized protein LOC112694964 n=1 Tax=Athalia rosae TaxID=37344 RepID=UPI00203322DA